MALPGYRGPAAGPGGAERVGAQAHLTVLHELARGGIGRVLLAYDEIIGRRVALKELLADQVRGEVVNSFIHEAKITGKLEHPGIVPVYELGYRSGGRPFYVMRYLKGETLEQLLEKTARLGPARAVVQRVKLIDILISVCDTLAYAHARGVIHRDLKPGNIVSGGYGETIVVDWGLARVVDDAQDTVFYRDAMTHQRHTLSDPDSIQVVGTPAYMAPEQFRGLAGKPADVYALGVILYRIITGEVPYRGSWAEIQARIEASSATPSAARRGLTVPPELIAICDKAVHRDPEQRFADAAELAAQLRAFREGRMVNVYAYSRKELLRRFVTQNRGILAMAVLVLITVIGGAGFSFHYARQMVQAQVRAEEALVVLTALSEQSQQQARTITQVIKAGIERLFADLRDAAARLPKADKDAAAQLIEQMRLRYPRFDTIRLRDPTEVSIAFSKDGGTSPLAQARPIAEFDQDNRLMVLFRVPVEDEGRITAYLEARGVPERLLAGFLPLRARSEQHPRVTWIMRSDGLIVFDEVPSYIGANVFVDLVDAPSSLQAFGRQVLTDDQGLGHYSVIEGSSEVSKIAAWDTIRFDDERGWKIIVSYAYMMKPAAARPRR